jgi:TonB family protein
MLQPLAASNASLRDDKEVPVRQSVLRLKLLAIALASAINSPVAAQEDGETVAWNSVKTSESISQRDAFLTTYPTGQFTQGVRQKYSRIADTMQAPQVQKIEVAFPNQIRRYGRSVGPIRVVKLTIVVGKDGKARDVQIAQSSGFSLYDQAALSAAREATYLPAVNHGTSEESRLGYDVSFGLLCNRAAGNSTCDHGRYPTTCSATVCALLMR